MTAMMSNDENALAGSLSKALPAKQERSRALRDRMIARGRELVAQGGFEGASLGEIAAACNCSVGALYFRFKDKQALFDCIVEVAMAEALARHQLCLDEARYTGKSPDKTIKLILDDYIAFIRREAGLIRALHQSSVTQPERWNIARETSLQMMTGWARDIEAAAGRQHDKAFRRQINIAFQLVAGILLHAIFLDPLVLRLEDPEMASTLYGVFNHLIGDQPASPKAKRSKRSG